jgi:hypothetical protein
MMPPPVLDAPIQQSRPAPEFLPPPPMAVRVGTHSSTRAAAAAWHSRAAAVREAKRPVFSKFCEPRLPTPEQVALAERFRRIAASHPVNPSKPAVTIVQQNPQPASLSSQDDSFADSFFSTVLQNKSIIDSDVNDMGCLVDVSQPPLTPTVHPATKPALFANNVLPIYAALPNPPPPSDQQWVRELIGSIGDISGIESMETANTSMHLGAGYHQCKVARRGKVSNSHFDVSVERGGGEKQSLHPHI